MVSSIQTPAIFPGIADSLNQLRRLNTQNIQHYWQQSENISTAEVFARHLHSWPIALLNDRQHIAWEKGRQAIWLYQLITIPAHLQGYPLSGLTLRLALTWWADDAQIYVNGTLVQSGDLFECFTRICLSESATPGETIQIAIHLVSPGHDNGALVRSHLTYELPPHYPTPEPSFIADELTVLATLEPDSQPEIESAIAQLNWDSLKTRLTLAVDQDSALQIWETLSEQPSLVPAVIHPFQQSLSELRRKLLPFSPKIKQRQIECVGHAHLDMAWLWPIEDTWVAAERTFKSILNLQENFPNLTYTHSSPALFNWVKNNRPALFQQIQAKVAAGSWSIDAGLWVEPEFNIISGESIARHILYGQRYCQEQFDKISKIAWLPDSFGFCWQLPQLLAQGGIETFATLKLSWNDTTEFPHKLFWWQSPDGSKVRALMLPPIGSDIDPVKMVTHAKDWENHTNIPSSLWLPGLGDHGGGPTRDMLEKSQRWEKSPFFPKLKFTTPDTYVGSLSMPTNNSEQAIPTWNSELYLELHRGCYTTHADQKKHNRRCEDLLYQAEVFATVAHLIAKQAYPKDNIETAWKELLFNQFHDILPGTSIPEVFAEANRGWETVYRIGQRVLEDSLSAIATTIQVPTPPDPDAKPVLVFNPLSWTRSSVITLSISKSSSSSGGWAVWDAESNQPVSCQTSSCDRAERVLQKISFQAKDLPAIGYRCFWLCPTDQALEQLLRQRYTLENEFLEATIDSQTGHVISLIEKATQTETFIEPGNQLQAFQEKSQYWDAWNIDPDYQNQSLPAPLLKSITWVETGSIRQKLQVTYKFQKSTIHQYYVLEAGSPFLKVETQINWQETHVLLKARFPLTILSDAATYEIPFGAIARTANPQTAAEKAQWEVPALRWADLSSQPFGVSILTDCKHGFDAGPNYLRLTLLKSPMWPDPEADRGSHTFTYAIYPHSGSWQSACTVQRAREFNITPIVHYPNPQPSDQKYSQPSRSFLEIQNSNVILSALKLAEEDSNSIILRCYESQGDRTELKITNSLNLVRTNGNELNLLELRTKSKQTTVIEPWKITTHQLKNQSSEQEKKLGQTHTPRSRILDG